MYALREMAPDHAAARAAAVGTALARWSAAAGYWSALQHDLHVALVPEALRRGKRLVCDWCARM